MTKPPSIRAKVPNYDGRWAVEIYDTKSNLIFPCSDGNLTPVDFIPKQSQVACVLQCGGIWIGGKGWGLTWKLIQCVVKPREVVSVFGKCHIELSTEERDTLETQKITGESDVEEQPSAVEPTSTIVEDSDDEKEPEAEPEPVTEVKEEPKPVVKK